MKFKKVRSGASAEWKSTAKKGNYYISRFTSYSVSYEVTFLNDDGTPTILGTDLQYLRDAKEIAENYELN